MDSRGDSLALESNKSMIPVFRASFQLNELSDESYTEAYAEL